MSAIKIECIIHGNIPESGTESVYYVTNPITFNKISQYFPFEGNFHFRILVPGQYVNSDKKNLWLDLNNELDHVIQQLVNDFFNDSIRIQALLLNELDDNVYDYTKYNQSLINISKNIIKNRPDRQISKITSQNDHKKSKSNITLKTVKEGATSVWKTFKATAAQLQQSLINNSNSSTLSDSSVNNLSQLSDEVAFIYNEETPEHSSLMLELWRSLFLNEPFVRYSDKWKEAGFQKNDPAADLKTSGLLAIKSMIYLGKNYPIKTQEMLKNNKQNITSKYPFAIVGINITILLIEVLKLRDQRYLSFQVGYWEMFESPHSFYEIFCAIFFHIDSIWTINNCVRKDFSKIMSDVRLLISEVLMKSPKSLMEFRHYAIEAGMLFPEV